MTGRGAHCLCLSQKSKRELCLRPSSYATWKGDLIMTDRTFMRLGGLLGIAIAVDAILAVLVYFLLVPAAQRLIPFQGAEPFLASLAQDSGALQLYYF